MTTMVRIRRKHTTDSPRWQLTVNNKLSTITVLERTHYINVMYGYNKVRRSNVRGQIPTEDNPHVGYNNYNVYDVGLYLLKLMN